MDSRDFLQFLAASGANFHELLGAPQLLVVDGGHGPHGEILRHREHALKHAMELATRPS